uniref:DUF4352 domain-containing protein n=1 Tax=Roseburia sp. TaxID=2049040 RepID=UPI003FF11FB6
MENETKLCKHCKSEIPKGAKVCPNCRKKQGGIGKWIVIAVVVIVLIAAVSGGGDNKDKNPQKVGETTTGTASAKEETSGNDADNTSDTKQQETEEVSNVFQIGDVVETENFKITFVSAGAYESDNEFLQPKDGCEYWQFEFRFENISDTDQAVSSMMDWECYADNAKADQTWIGDDNGLDATLSAGRETQGTIYFEVPKDVQSVELEYDINFWQSDKIVFVGK